MEEASPSEEGISDGTQSDHGKLIIQKWVHFSPFITLLGSVTYPYRTQLKDTSFPRCHLISTPKAGAETYMRSLFMLGNGTPIWDPVGDLSRPKASPESGIMIGDIGLLTHEGDFVCYFNIFLTPEDAPQYRCPPDLVPLHPPPEDADIATIPMHFPPGTTLVSRGVTASVHPSSPL